MRAQLPEGRLALRQPALHDADPRPRRRRPLLGRGAAPGRRGPPVLTPTGGGDRPRERGGVAGALAPPESAGAAAAGAVRGASRRLAADGDRHPEGGAGGGAHLRLPPLREPRARREPAGAHPAVQGVHAVQDARVVLGRQPLPRPRQAERHRHRRPRLRHLGHPGVHPARAAALLLLGAALAHRRLAHPAATRRPPPQARPAAHREQHEQAPGDGGVLGRREGGGPAQTPRPPECDDVGIGAPADGGARLGRRPARARPGAVPPGLRACARAAARLARGGGDGEEAADRRRLRDEGGRRDAPRTRGASPTHTHAPPPTPLTPRCSLCR